jgi:hypothetical protein
MAFLNFTMLDPWLVCEKHWDGHNTVIRGSDDSPKFQATLYPHAATVAVINKLPPSDVGDGDEEVCFDVGHDSFTYPDARLSERWAPYSPRAVSLGCIRVDYIDKTRLERSRHQKLS